jgi:cell wall-associated NlpC family hydrolase
MDFNAYVGIPFRDRGRAMDGANCWGLIVLFFERELCIQLPAFDDRAAALTDLERSELSLVVAGVRDDGAWLDVAQGQHRPGDVVLFRIAGELAHMGIVSAPDRFLHMRLRQDAGFESLSSLLWARRIASFHRHVACV